MDPSWRRPASGDAVIAGSPVRVFRLTAAGRGIAEAIERGDEVPESGAPLTEKLLDAGAIHPLPDEHLHGIDPAEITVVIPAFVDRATVADRVAALVGGFSGTAEVIVVDDASPLPLPTPTAGDTTVRVERRPENGGPAAARNTGLALARTEWVVFVDSDVVAAFDDVAALAAWVAHPRTAAIAPRVRSIGGSSTIERYESSRSPLDAGPMAARVRPGSRVPYVPAAMLLCNVGAIRAIGGFDESLRTGEDVDLVWRLDRSGHHVRYEPAVEVGHHPRTELSALVRQRIGYGASTTALHRKHGSAVAPLRATWSNLGTWVSLIVGVPVVGVVLASITAARLIRKLDFLPDAKVEAVRLAATAQLRTGRNLAAAITRVWWPVALVIGLFSKRARITLCAAALVPSLAEWWNERPALDPLRYACLRVVDDASYGIGAIDAAWRERTPAALAPEIVSWSSSED